MTQIDTSTEAVEALADRIEELEANLAKAVDGVKTAKGFYQVTHVHAALDATLSELTGGKDD